VNLDLHAEVRGAINSSNSDIPMQYLQSTGSTVSTAGKPTPTYAAPVTVQGQVQPIGGQDLKKYPFLQVQGVYRSIHLFGNVAGIIRGSQTGGDLLQFADPTETNGTVYTWLVRAVPETWNTGWCRVLVSRQLDPNNPT
jgi:hypothetical protein